MQQNTFQVMGNSKKPLYQEIKLHTICFEKEEKIPRKFFATTQCPLTIFSTQQFPRKKLFNLS